MAAAAVVVAGQAAAPYLARLGVQLPADYWRAMAEKKMAFLMGIWFVGAWPARRRACFGPPAANGGRGLC